MSPLAIALTVFLGLLGVHQVYLLIRDIRASKKNKGTDDPKSVNYNNSQEE